jgi:hypothetical protein
VSKDLSSLQAFLGPSERASQSSSGRYVARALKHRVLLLFCLPRHGANRGKSGAAIAGEPESPEQKRARRSHFIGSSDLKVQELEDAYYIRNWSLRLDVYILPRILDMLLTPKGAY